jgi:hypothetical protein
MKVQITINKTIGDIKKEFTAAWPHLMLGFYSKPHTENHGSNAKFMVTDDHLTVSQLGSGYQENSELTLEADMPVREVERLLEEKFGLHTQIFRHSGSVWLQTTVSDKLTLDQQEERGIASDYVPVVENEPFDYREMD